MTATITPGRVRAAELHRQLNLRAVEDAYARGMNLSRWLEEEDPSDGYHDGLDAFERQLKVAGIVTKTNAERGFYADELATFEKNEQTRALQVEWIARQWRKISHASPAGAPWASRAIISSDDTTVGGILKPWIDAAAVRFDQIAPAIPLAELVALHTQINSNVYRALYLFDDDPSQTRWVRVGEAGEIPGSTLTSGEHAIDLFKFGRKIKITYEAMRRLPIDTVAFHIARMAIQAESDKVAKVIGVLLNGDGNPGTAATVHNLTSLDSAASGKQLTLKAWLRFKMQFANPYQLTHVLAQEDAALQLMLLNTGSGNVPLVTIQAASGFGSFTPINPGLADNLRLGYTADAPADKIVGFDRRFGIERISEIGGSITEMARWVTNQTQDLVMTEVEGYAVFDGKAARVLDLAA